MELQNDRGTQASRIEEIERAEKSADDPEWPSSIAESLQIRKNGFETAVIPIEIPKSERANLPEVLPLSLLNDFLYCARRAALKVVEGWRSGNEHTVRGDIVHEHADIPGYEVAKGAKLLRALPVFSERLGLNGKCDIVEQRQDGTLYPVEYKVGKRRRFENDDAQLCAQALCLEEMFGVTIERGAVFHSESKRRREVEFTRELRESTLEAIAAVRAFPEQSETSNLKSGIHPLPPPVFKPACEECSLFEICLPRVAGNSPAAAQAERRLFEI